MLFYSNTQHFYTHTHTHTHTHTCALDIPAWDLYRIFFINWLLDNRCNQLKLIDTRTDHLIKGIFSNAQDANQRKANFPKYTSFTMLHYTRALVNICILLVTWLLDNGFFVRIILLSKAYLTTMLVVKIVIGWRLWISYS